MSSKRQPLAVFSFVLNKKQITLHGWDLFSIHRREWHEVTESVKAYGIATKTEDNGHDTMAYDSILKVSSHRITAK